MDNGMVLRPVAPGVSAGMAPDGRLMVALNADPTKSADLTKSGKALLLASTRGWIPVAPGMSLSLNLVYRER